MIALIKEKGEYRLNDSLMIKHQIENAANENDEGLKNLKAIYKDLHEQVMKKWTKESKEVSAANNNQNSLFNKTNLFDLPHNSRKTQQTYISGNIVNNSQQLLPYITVRDPILQKTMFNKYLQWSGSIDQTLKDVAASVGLPRIDPNTNQFYRTIIPG